MALNTELILTLKNLKGIGNKTILGIAEKAPSFIRTIEDLNLFWKKLKGKKFVPDPDYALSLSFEHEYPEINLDREQALEYLHHDTLRFPQAPLGFNTVCYLGKPLGFVNNLGNRCNNLHPNERRILMNIK